jgi:chromosome segregation ATPase
MKALTLTLCVLAILGSAASGYFYYEIGNTKQKLRSDLQAANIQIGSLDSRVKATIVELESEKSKFLETEASLGETKTKLTTALARATQFERDLGTAKTQLTTAQEAEKKFSNELADMRKELVQARLATTTASPSEIEGYKSTIASLEARIASLTSGSSTRTSSTTATTSGTENIKVRPASLSWRADNARVANVGPKNAFVVLEVGSIDGAAVGQKYVVKRDSQVIAEAIISSVQDNSAIAQVLASSIKTTITVGDTAAFTN